MQAGGGGKVDLSNCDREPIHIPGAIQPHGAMLVFDRQSLRVRQVAGATQRLIGRLHDQVLGAAAADLFHPEQAARLHALAERAPTPRHLLDPTLRVRADLPVDASVHAAGEALIVEFEEADPGDIQTQEPLACVQEMILSLAPAADVGEFCRKGAEAVRSTTGFDRAMIYRFLDDGAGWVFAEDKRDGLTPFLDLHYPASDIPVQARALYLRNPVRVISSSDYTPAPLVPAGAAPLDMSQAILRDVSPIHREYLRNMGVAASMSISIVIRGRLWGLIACHHYTPRVVRRPLRAICEIFGAVFSLELEARLRSEQHEAQLRSRGALNVILRGAPMVEDFAGWLAERSELLLGYIDAGGLSLQSSPFGGLAMKVDAEISSFGRTPSKETIRELTSWLAQRAGWEGGVFITDRLPELWPPAASFADLGAGLLAIAISREPSDYLLWFRPEWVHTVQWGGDPAKPAQPGPNGDRLTPRKSFEAWAQDVHGRSAPWRDSERVAAAELRVALMELVLRRLDLVLQERVRAREQERMLMAELNHRFKNALANIQAIVAFSGRKSGNVKEMVEAVNARIVAMSDANQLLLENKWSSVELEGLVRNGLAQYAGTGGRVVASGPRVALTPEAAMAIRLVLHELTTNAIKYGALSNDAGQVRIDWRREAPALRLVWREIDGPEVRPPARRGFGSALIERLIGAETGGKCQLRFEPSGLVCEIELARAGLADDAEACEPEMA